MPLELVIASEDGGQLYVVDATGRHLRTVDALTGHLLYQFGCYNAAGLLVTVTDLDNDVTTIERDANGNATAIVGPFGARTTLGAPDANGYLTSIANPAGETVQLTYSTNGLLRTLTDPRQHLHQFQYDDLGCLLRDEDPVGGFTALSRTETPFGYEITTTNALNIRSRYREETLPDGSRLRLTIGADGGTNISLTALDGGTTNWLADGTATIMHEGPDPRFGMQSPIPATVTTMTPGGLVYSVTASQSVNLANPGDPLSVVSQTNTVSLNGKPFTTVYNFDGVNRIVTTVSPLQRTSASILDDKGRVLQSAVPQIAPVNFQYDSHGRLQTVSQTANNQTRTVTYAYDQTQNGGASSGRLTAITDSLNRTNTFTYDPNLSGRKRVGS